MQEATHDQLVLFPGACCEGPGCDRDLFRFGKGWRRRFCSTECAAADRRAREGERYASDPEWRAARLAREAARYAAEGERIRERGRKWRERNAEKIRQRERGKYAADPSVKRKAAMDWYRANPEAVKANRHRRRFRKQRADVRKILPRDLRRLEHRQRGCCIYCGKPGRLTIEHLIPLSRGGRDAIGNLALACFSCNASKRDLLVMEFRLDRPRRRRAG